MTAEHDEQTEHYAYCKVADCPGCLPSDAAVNNMGLWELWGEMLNRCIAQTPATKTRAGAIAAIVADGPTYRSHPKVLRADA